MAIAAAALAGEGAIADRKRHGGTEDAHAAGRAGRLLRAGRAGPVHRRRARSPTLQEQNRERGYFPWRGDGRLCSSSCTRAIWCDAAHARIPDGRARAGQRPDGLEQRHHAHAGAHAPRISASLYLHNALAMGTYRVGGTTAARLLADLHLPVFMVGTTRDHVCPGARSTSCTTCAMPRSASRWSAAGTTPASFPGVRPCAPQLPFATAAGARRLDRGGRLSARPPSTKVPGGPPGSSGLPGIRHAGVRAGLPRGASRCGAGRVRIEVLPD